ncbi:MAG: recombinase family protein [Microvirga sp.]|nr:recombinase family protein [Microvirga sp.]
MAKVGYARVSTTDQDLSTQVERLKVAGCEIIRSEKVTGTTRTGRSELASVLEFLRRGDELVVTRIDRLARSIADLQDIVRELKRKGAYLRAADQPIDTSTAAGKAFLDMLGVFAEFETNLRRERQLEGFRVVRDHSGSTGSICPLPLRGAWIRSAAASCAAPDRGRAARARWCQGRRTLWPPSAAEARLATMRVSSLVPDHNRVLVCRIKRQARAA